MNKSLLIAGAMALFASSANVQAATYNVTTTWLEPETEPNDSIFIGSFDFDDATKSVSNLNGILSESMTGDGVGYPNDSMIWLNLDYQLHSWYDAALGGTFAATFRNPNTTTFYTDASSKQGDEWRPGHEVVYAGWPKSGTNPGNAYALIFVPDAPLIPLSQAQIDMLAYADCAPGGMMGATCMTGTSVGGYGMTGTMSGYPVSQIITAAVPEPETYAMLMTGIGLMGFMARRRRSV